MPTAMVAPAGPQGGQTGQPGLPPPAMLAQKALAEAAETLGRIATEAGAQTAPETADTVESLLKGGATGQAREILLSSPTAQAKAVSDLVGRAAPAQGGMAPLLADLERVSTSPDAPAVVRQAAANMLALRSPIDGAVTAGEIRQAFSRSGLFMEQRLAEEAEPNAAPLAAKDLKAAMLVLRAAVASWSAQTGPAGPSSTAASAAPSQTPSAAGSTAAAVATSPALAAPVEAQADPVSTSTLQTTGAPAQPALAGEGAPTPLARSASAAATPAEPETAPPAPAAPDEAAETPVARFLAAVAPRPTPAQAAQPAAALFVLAQEAAAGFEEPVVRQPLAQTPLTPPGKGPPPPFAGGPVVAQAAVTSTLAHDAPPATVAHQLSKGVDAALARQELMQAASLPDRTDTARAAQPLDGRAVEEKTGPRWVFDVPFATPQGSSVAQFEISRDGGGGGAAGGPDEARTWKVRFSLDVEPMGRIDAQLALTGERARVSLWAERTETMTRLRGGQEILDAALREAALEPEVAFHASPAPVAAPPAPGRFVDRAT